MREGVFGNGVSYFMNSFSSSKSSSRGLYDAWFDVVLDDIIIWSEDIGPL